MSFRGDVFTRGLSGWRTIFISCGMSGTQMTKYSLCITSPLAGRVRGESCTEFLTPFAARTIRTVALLLDVDRGQIFNFNLVGSRIFELLKSGFSEAQIVANVSHEFEVSVDLAGADVREFLETLKDQRLVEAPNLVERGLTLGIRTAIRLRDIPRDCAG